MENEKIRKSAKCSGVALWKIAEHIGVSEPTITRWLRSPLSAERETKMLCAIKELAGGDFIGF